MIIPLLLGIAVLALEVFLFGHASDKVELLGFFLTSSISAAFLLLVYKRFDVCGWFVISICGGILVTMLFSFLIISGLWISYTSGYIIMTNWIGINLVCFVVRLFDRNSKVTYFNHFFRLSSIIFAFIYIPTLIYALFFKSIGFKGINLVPFMDIRYDLLNISGTNFLYSNTFINIFLFIPLGFYLNILGTKFHILTRASILISIPIIVEIIQYITSSGISDIDDVILNFTGGLIGMLLSLLLEKAYSIIRKSPDKRMLEF